MDDEVKTCPWCGKEARMVMVMVVTDRYTQTERVCAECRKRWLKKLRKMVEGGAR